QPISRCYRLDSERTIGQVTEESHFSFGAQPGTQEVDHLGDDECRDDQRARMGLQKLQRRRMVCVVGVNVGIQRARIDDNCPYRPTSAARISSIRSETSLRPLRPAAAAFRRRRPPGSPRYASSASRLTSEMVKFRRRASCRRRASSASGILTVVRFMYASIPSGVYTVPTGSSHRVSHSPKRRSHNKSSSPITANRCPAAGFSARAAPEDTCLYTGAVATSFADIAKAQYILLTTFTKDGRPKPTPIWAANDG